MLAIEINYTSAFFLLLLLLCYGDVVAMMVPELCETRIYSGDSFYWTDCVV